MTDQELEHPDQPPSPADGPRQQVNESDLEEVGHAAVPDMEDLDLPVDDNLIEREDLVQLARDEAGDEYVDAVLRAAGGVA